MNREYLAEGGVYAPAGDVAAFTAAIAALAGDEAWRLALGQGLRRRVVEQFTWTTAAERINDLYTHLTNRA